MSERGRPMEPFLWALFSSGGMLAALALPAAFFVSFLAVPLGLLDGLSREALLSSLLHPAVRAALFVLVALSLAHWAHRFRYTLYDGLQLYHLNLLIAVLTYGTAAALTVVAAVVLW
ncbi:MAG: fumarate reductase subunit FrdD [Thermoanaerobaculia bacterium]